ncbi:hypothetical protein [Nostoc sp. FACHB-133]|uniref:hypothetical protein n=1 Tax=Nostoc sp. FACHB-133 TaxID=2692835 RepID=UPI001F557B79|nr:hypothetical protein [Nostoc sp. FACHB-133]
MGTGKNNYLLPNAQCPMPNTQCPMPNAQCPIPNSHFHIACAKIKPNLRAKAKWSLYPCQESKTMKPIRQGDVILLPVQQIEGQKIPHLTLAEGEVTRHKHRITEGSAELYDKDSTLYLRVFSESALLAHEEHKAISIPQGDWMVKIQREYEPEGWRYVAD